MAKINLLPWREELRKKRQQDFLIAMGVAVGATCIIFGLVYLQIEAMKEYHTQRNDKIREEIKIVDGKIKEIKEIEEKKNALSKKIDLIQGLQESRPKIVHLFDDLRKVTPAGIFLVNLTQKGEELTVTGKSQSNARVSDYMWAIEKSAWLTDPKLKFVKGLGNSNTKTEANDFTMIFKQKPDKPKDEDQTTDKNAGAK